MFEMTGLNTSLNVIVRENGPHYLLQALKEGSYGQNELDSALHEAAFVGDIKCVRYLMVAGADIWSSSEHNEPLMISAVYSGDPALVRLLLDVGYDVDYKVGHTCDTGMVVPLHVALQSDYDVSCHLLLEVLLNAGASTEFRDVDGDTPLIAATVNENLDIVTKLVNAGCNVNSTGYENNTALNRAVKSGSAAIVSFLLASGADPHLENDDGVDALGMACLTGMVDSAQALLTSERLKVNPKQLTVQEKNYMHLAASGGEAGLVDMLSHVGIDLNAQDNIQNTPLTIAAGMGHKEFVLQLLRLASDTLNVNIRGDDERTALHWAAMHGWSDVTTTILQRSASIIDGQDSKGDTALILASQNNRATVIDLLLRYNANVNIQGHQCRTAVHRTILQGDCDSLASLLAVTDIQLEQQDDDGNSVLLLAVLNHKYPQMRKLLQYDLDLNVQGADGRSVLHWLCERGYMDMLRQILQKDSILLNESDNNGDVPLLLAAKKKHDSVVCELVARGADVNKTDQDGRIALIYTALEGLMSSSSALISAGVNTDTQDKSGKTALIAAAEAARVDVIELLVTSSCDVNIADKEGRTALFYTAQKGLTDSVKLCLAAGSATDLDACYSSALIQASKHGHVDTVRHLLEYGANTERRDDHNRTALLWAAQGGHVDILTMLVTMGTDTKLADSSGDTALTLAAFSGKVDALNYLIPLSDLDHRESEEGMSALLLAISKQYGQCVDVLLKAGASVHVLDNNGNNALLTTIIHTLGIEILITILQYAGPDLDINFTGWKERAAIHWATGEPEALRNILQYDPDVNLLDGNGASPLLLAVAHGRPDSAAMLIEAGCDIQKVHQDGRSAIHHTAIYGDSPTLALLLQKGIHPDTSTEDGRTPLLLASIEGHVTAVEQLLLYGCEINRVYFDAVTALYMAITNRHYSVAEMLLTAGADPDLIGSKKSTALINSTLNCDKQSIVLLLQSGADVDQGITANKHLIQVASIKGHLDLVYLFVSVMCDPNVLRRMLNDGVLFYFIQDDELLRVLRFVSRTPLKLKALCRHRVRSSISFPLLPKLDSLPVPPTLKPYLALKDLQAFVESPVEIP